MRILMLTQWFDPEPFFKGLTFAKALRGRGHEVEVVTGFPNYPEGKVYAGYRQKPWQRESMDGVPVIRVPLYASHDASPVRRAANYASFAASAALVGTILAKRADVMYVYHPPATVAFPAAVIGAARRIPFVYDIQDLWPDTLSATGMVGSPRLLGAVGAWCRLAYRAASRIVVLSPGFREALVRRGVPAGKIDVIYNWCEEGPIARSAGNDAPAPEPGFAGRFNIVFAGTMGKAQALDAVLGAAGLLAGKAPAIRFVFVGGGVEAGRLAREAEARRLPNVAFLPRRPVSEIGGLLARADALLVHLKDDPLFRITIPSKIQAYLAAGRPILNAVPGDAADLVARSGAGISCAPESPEAIAAAAESLHRMTAEERQAMGARGAGFYRRELSLAAGVDRFEAVFRAAAGAA